MPMDYLKRIEKADFPLRVEAAKDINNVAVLSAAGFVEAEILKPIPNDPGATGEVAYVFAITPLGRQKLAEFQEDLG